jgi:hypothetical protein
MAKWLWASLLVAIVMVPVRVAGSKAGEPQQPLSLDTLWEKHMMEGTFVVMRLEDSRGSIVEINPKSVDPTEVDQIYGPNFSHSISIMKLGEGLFGNGGWVLSGGLLGRVRHGLSTFELYVKEVGRRFSHIPFPPHRDIPKEVGYEFFLLRRSAESQDAIIIRKWVFKPASVKNPSDPFVQANLRYDKTTRIATLEITGLKEPFEERIDLSVVK